MCKGQRPIGAAKGKQTNTMALCQPPPLPSATPATAAAHQVPGPAHMQMTQNAPTLWPSKQRSPGTRLPDVKCQPQWHL